MYYVSKRIEIAGAHCLHLPYESKCSNIHGHNWIITIHCRAKELTTFGMVVDFTDIKNKIHSRLDHKFLNDIIPFNPTAENMAKWICNEVTSICTTGECYKVEVQESEGNIATYEVD